MRGLGLAVINTMHVLFLTSTGVLDGNLVLEFAKLGPDDIARSLVAPVPAAMRKRSPAAVGVSYCLRDVADVC